jgi:long-chain acyl-CoA synthetase
MINTAGYKVWPREVEEILYSHAGVKLAAVVGVADDYRGEIVKAFVVPRESADDQLTQEEIIAFCRSRLAAYKVPRAIEFRSDLPVSGAGKVLRRVLRECSGGT